jgi:hypothetical protein
MKLKDIEQNIPVSPESIVELGFVLLLFGYAFIGFIVITVIYSYI